MKRWIAILLIASVVANVFLLGLLAGGAWHLTHHPGVAFRSDGLGRAARLLPEAQGQALRQAIRATVRQAAPRLREGRAARADAAHLFAQPQFDAKAITAKLDQALASDMTLRAALDHRMVGFAATLPQAQREKLAVALESIGPTRESVSHQYRKISN